MFTKTASIKPAVQNGHHPTFVGKERSVSSFIPPVQAKLNIGKKGDPYEIEADQVADKVVHGSNFDNGPSFFQPATTIQKKEQPLQKQETGEELQKKPLVSTITPMVQMEQVEEETVQQKCESCEHDPKANEKEEGSQTVQKKEGVTSATIQAKTDGSSNFDSHIGNRIQNARGRGSRLSKPVRSLMESRFGADFGGVKIHTGSTSAAMNNDLGARAFTTGNDIFFNKGQFNADTKDGQLLLAHELTHTIQQGASTAKEPDLQKKESEVDMEELKKQLEESSAEQKAAFDPSEANKARKEAAAKGLLAEQLANSELEEIPPVLPEVVEVEETPQGSRMATPIPQKPDVVVPSSQKKKADAPAQKEKSSEKTSDATSASPEPIESNAGGAGESNGASTAGAQSEGGTTQQYLEQQSADVCNKGAKKAQELADNESAHDTAKEKAGQTEIAVVPPKEEGQSRGNAGQVTSLEGAVPPQPNDQQIKKDMDQAISNAVPKKIKELNEFESEKKAQVIGNKVLAGTKKQVGEVQGTYNEIEKAATPTESDTPVGLPSVEQAPNTGNLNLGKGAVPSVPEAQTDLSHFEEEADGVYEKEGISQDMQKEFENVDSGDIAEANKEKVLLKEKVASEPENLQNFAATQQQTVESDLQSEENKVKSSMEDKRKKELDGAKGKQVKTKTDLEKKREAVTEWINTRYTTAKDFVTDKLAKLETQALEAFDKGQKLHSLQFEQNVKRRVNAWKSDRYSGFWGAAKWLKDKVVGIDHFPTIKNIFVTERATFVKAIDLLIVNINTENEKTIQLCKDEIANAKTAIQDFIDKLGPELIDVGKKAQEETTKKLAELDQHIEKEKKKLQQKLCDKKDEAIKAIDKKIEEMKSEMSGLVGKLGALLLYAAKKFFKWAISKIGGSADKIIAVLDKGATVLKKLFTDPIGFFKNLVKAVGGGIRGFVTNIVTWLKKGLVGWLMGQMGDSGLELPEKFDMKGIIFMGLQVAGLTWNVIRARIVKALGPKGETIMSTAEKTVDIIKRVVKEGPIVLWDIILEKANEIKSRVMEGIRNWAIMQIIKKMSFKLLSMLNPAGAIVQAIMLLYDVVMFFIENWNRIVDFVKSVFDSVGEIASGAIGKAAGFIEKTLGMTVPIILSFAARFVGLSGIGTAIRKIIKTIQKPFKKILDRMIKFLVKQVKKLFKSGKAKVKGAIAKVLQWWKLRKKFKGKDGKDHTLYLEGTGRNARMMVASNPTKVDVLLRHKLKTADETKKKVIQSAIQKATANNDLIKKLSLEKDDNIKGVLNKKLDVESNSLKKMLSTILDVEEQSIVTFLDKWLGKKVWTKKKEPTKKFADGAQKVGYQFFETDTGKQIRRSSKDKLPKLTIMDSQLKEGAESSEKPTHDNFIPDVITITQNGKGYIAKYATKSSDGKKTSEFVIELSFDEVIEGLPDITEVRKVKGKKLSNKADGIGRGKWDSATGGFHNAHIIGDQFGGSGKNFAMNIHPSSPDYNTGDMASVENKMAREFKKKGEQYDMEATAYLKDDDDSAGKLKALLKEQFGDDNKQGNTTVPKEVKANAENDLIKNLQSEVSKDMKALPAQFIKITYHSESIPSKFEDENFDSASKTITLGKDEGYKDLKAKFKAEKVGTGTKTIKK